MNPRELDLRTPSEKRRMERDELILTYWRQLSKEYKRMPRHRIICAISKKIQYSDVTVYNVLKKLNIIKVTPRKKTTESQN